MLFFRCTKLCLYFRGLFSPLFPTRPICFLFFIVLPNQQFLFSSLSPSDKSPSFIIYSILNRNLLKISPRFRPEFAISLLATALFLSTHSLPVRHFEIRNTLFWLFWPIFVYILLNVSITTLPASFM